MDTWGTVQRYVRNAATREFKVEVEVNSVFLHLDENKLEDYDDYHAKRKSNQ